MSNPAKSVFVHGIYLVFSGLNLIIAPNLLLGLLGIPATSEVWIRVLGVLTLNVGFYFVQAARKEVIEFMRWTVYARLIFMAFCVVFVLLGFTGPVLLLFGLLDLLGAVWTALALRWSGGLTNA
jgi:hypothetical protein